MGDGRLPKQVTYCKANTTEQRLGRQKELLRHHKTRFNENRSVLEGSTRAWRCCVVRSVFFIRDKPRTKDFLSHCHKK